MAPLQSLRSLNLPKSTVKRTKWQMSRLAREVEQQAIGKTQGRPRAKWAQRSLHDIRILQRQGLVVEQHFDRCGKAGGVKPVNGSKDPEGFGQRQNGYPNPFLHKVGGLSGLRSVVSSNEPNQNVGVNGAHSARGCPARSPLSSHRECGAPAAH